MVNGYTDVGPASASRRCPPRQGWAISGQRGPSAEVCGSGVHTTFPPGTPGTPARPGWTLTHSTSAPRPQPRWLRAWRWPVGTHREMRIFWIGPSFATSRSCSSPPGQGSTTTTQILSLGVSLEVAAHPASREAVAAAEVRTVYKETFLCPDRDNDGVPTMWTTALTWRVRWIIGAARSTGARSQAGQARA